MGRLQYFVQLTSTHLLCYEEARVVAKVSRSTLQKDIQLCLNKRWRIEKVADAPEKYKVTHTFDYVPVMYLYVTDAASVVPFRASLIQEIALLVIFLSVALWTIFTREMMSSLNHTNWSISVLVLASIVFVATLQFGHCVRYVMLYKQNKIYYSWF